MAYITPDLLQLDFNDLTDWTDADAGGAVSEISPAGQLHLDLRSLVANNISRRNKDCGTVGNGNYYVEIKFIGDAWDGFGGDYGYGILVSVGAVTNRLFFCIGNGFASPAMNGILVNDGVNPLSALVKTWDNNWHTITFLVHNNQTDVDIWIDKDPMTEVADATDIDCSYATDTDGYIDIIGWGTPAGNGEYHIDYIYVGSEVIQENISLTLPTMNINLEMPLPTLSLLDFAWTFITKHISTFTNKSKNSASWTNKDKNSSSWTYKSK
jgi:hypothetical protein